MVHLQIMIQAIEMGVFDELETSQKPLTARALANKKDFNLMMTEKLLNSLSTIGLTRKMRGKDGNIFDVHVSLNSRVLVSILVSWRFPLYNLRCFICLISVSSCLANV